MTKMSKKCKKYKKCTSKKCKSKYNQGKGNVQ